MTNSIQQINVFTQSKISLICANKFKFKNKVLSSKTYCKENLLAALY